MANGLRGDDVTLTFQTNLDEFNSALDLCGQKELDKLKAALKVPANAEAKKKMEKTDKLLTMIVNDKSEDAASLQSPASELAGVVEELLDMGWEAGKISVRSGKKDGVLNGCAIFRRILLSSDTRQRMIPLMFLRSKSPIYSSSNSGSS